MRLWEVVLAVAVMIIAALSVLTFYFGFLKLDTYILTMGALFLITDIMYKRDLRRSRYRK